MQKKNLIFFLFPSGSTFEIHLKGTNKRRQYKIKSFIFIVERKCSHFIFSSHQEDFFLFLGEKVFSPGTFLYSKP